MARCVGTGDIVYTGGRLCCFTLSETLCFIRLWGAGTLPCSLCHRVAPSIALQDLLVYCPLARHSVLTSPVCAARRGHLY
jgi:hypothetical protein